MGRYPYSTRQYEVLRALQAHRRVSRMAPTIRELMRMTGITSTSVVAYYLDRLEKDGFIRRLPEIARGLDLTEEGLRFECGVESSAPDLGTASTRPHLLYRTWKVERDYLFYYRIRRRHLVGKAA